MQLPCSIYSLIKNYDINLIDLRKDEAKNSTPSSNEGVRYSLNKLLNVFNNLYFVEEGSDFCPIRSAV